MCALFLQQAQTGLRLPTHGLIFVNRRTLVYDFSVTNDHSADLHECWRLVYDFICVFTTLITQNIWTWYCGVNERAMCFPFKPNGKHRQVT